LYKQAAQGHPDVGGAFPDGRLELEGQIVSVRSLLLDGLVCAAPALLQSEINARRRLLEDDSKR
jgi:hypothetical protein